MKKLLSIVIGFLIIFSMTGCGESHEEDIKSSVNSYFIAIGSGDYDKAMEATAKENNDFDDDFGFEELVDSVTSQLIDENMGEVFNNAVLELIDYTISKSIKEYSIEDISEDNDEAVVLVSGQYIDFEKLNLSIDEMDTDAIADEYIKAHMNELTALYEEQGEEAVEQKVIVDIMPTIFDSMKELVDNAEYIDFNMEMKVKNIDGNWLISNIKEV